MGAFTKVLDAILFFYFLIMVFFTPLIDSQSCFSEKHYPEILVKARRWYIEKSGDYFYDQKPHFFVGMVWMEMFIHYPIVLCGVYAILTAKPWLNTISLIYGTSICTTMFALFGDIVGTGNASFEMLMNYYPHLLLVVVALVRGFLPSSSYKPKTKAADLPKKKRI